MFSYSTEYNIYSKIEDLKNDKFELKSGLKYILKVWSFTKKDEIYGEFYLKAMLGCYISKRSQTILKIVFFI